MADALRLDRVRAGYGETVVLEDVGFSLAEKSSLAVLGRNGVGKTTLLATIMGHTTFHSGEMAFRGQPLARMAAFERNRVGIGYVPQTRDIFPSLSVEENLTVAGRPGRWTLERVYELFPRLAERRSHMGNQISGGEQQMCSIGRACRCRGRRRRFLPFSASMVLQVAAEHADPAQQRGALGDRHHVRVARYGRRRRPAPRHRRS